MKTLAGVICVRNTDKLDYCWRESAQSLLNVCDQLVIADCDSTDGTTKAVKEWAARDSRIVYCNMPWTDPRGDIRWYVTWINFGRQHATTDHCVYLDADEILHEDSYNLVRQSAEQGTVLKCHRWNFWRDAGHLIPHGVCCGHKVIRVAPQRMWCPSDYDDDRCTDAQNAAVLAPVNIMHYGFLRKREAFFKKAKEVLRIWANDYDKRLEAADKAGGNWMTHPGVTGWEDKLVTFWGNHPALAIPWLMERGYCTETMTNEQLLTKWQPLLDEVSMIPTWTEPLTLAYLAELASKSTHAVELGTFHGASAAVMLKASPGCHLWCVDSWAHFGTRQLTEYFLRDHIKSGQCELIAGDSTVAAGMLQHMRGKLDFCWVDDGHETEQVMADIRNFLPLVRAGGRLVGHDFDIPHNDVAQGVIRSGIHYSLPVPRMWEHLKE